MTISQQFIEIMENIKTGKRNQFRTLPSIAVEKKLIKELKETFLLICDNEIERLCELLPDIEEYEDIKTGNVEWYKGRGKTIEENISYYTQQRDSILSL